MSLPSETTTKSETVKELYIGIHERYEDDQIVDRVHLGEICSVTVVSGPGSGMMLPATVFESEIEAFVRWLRSVLG